MIPNAPSDLDLRALITIEQVATLVGRTTWEDMLPVVLLLDEDFDLIPDGMRIIEDGQRLPAVWIKNFHALMEPLIEKAQHMLVSYKVGTIVLDENATGEVEITEHGVTETCVGHRHIEGYMIAVVGRDLDRPSTVLFIDRVTGEASWDEDAEIRDSEVIDAFERCMRGDL